MSEELNPIVEALIFASPDPLTPKALYKLLESEPNEDVNAALELLKRDYERPGGLQLVEVAGGYQIVTKPELHEWVRRLFQERSAQRLSVQALETLAVIAYKQPVTALEVSEIRGVNTSGVLGTLVDRRLVKVDGTQARCGTANYCTAPHGNFSFGSASKTSPNLPKKSKRWPKRSGSRSTAALNQPSQPELVDVEPDIETEPVTSE